MRAVSACPKACQIQLRSSRGSTRRNTRARCDNGISAAIAAELQEAQQLGEKTGKPARRFKDLRRSTLDSWSRARRVVAKAEWTSGEANPRFVVTSLSRTSTRPATSTRRSIAPAATWRATSRNASSTCSPTAPRPPPCAPTSCGYGLPRWPTCWFARCAASPSGTPSSPRPPAASFVSSCSRSARWCRQRQEQ